MTLGLQLLGVGPKERNCLEKTISLDQTRKALTVYSQYWNLSETLV